MAESSSLSNSLSLLSGKQQSLSAELRKNTKLSASPAFQKLKEYHSKHVSQLVLNNLFKSDPKRFDNLRYVGFFYFDVKKFTFKCLLILMLIYNFFSSSITLNTPHNGTILFDYSKNLINDDVLKMLLDLVRIFFFALLIKIVIFMVM